MKTYVGKSNDGMPLGDRAKEYEELVNTRIPKDKHIIIRLDGHCFGKFTKGFVKPADEFFNRVMTSTLLDVTKEFGAVTSFKQSDEMTLILPVSNKVTEKYFNIKDLENYNVSAKFIDGLYFLYVDNEPLYVNKDEIKYYVVYDVGIEQDFVLDLLLGDIRFGDFGSFKLLDKDTGTLKETRINKVQCSTSENTQIFSSRVQKLVSLTAAYTSMRFNHHWKIELDKFQDVIDKCYNKHTLYAQSDFEEDHDLLYVYKRKQDIGYFDSRVIGVSTPEEVYNIGIMWRSRDCIKNSKQGYAQAYCSHKELLNLSSEDQIQYCKEKTRKDWNTDAPEWFKYGVFVKKEKYEKTPGVIRTRYVTFSKQMSSFSDENVDLVMRKFLND